MYIIKKLFFSKKKGKSKQYNGYSKFQWGAKYEKATNFNLEQFYFIQNGKAFFNDTEH